MNYLAWLGPVVAFVGVMSYFLYFVRFPDLRDFPWVNLPLVGMGAVLSVVGFVRAFRGPGSGLLSKALAALGTMVSVGLAALFAWYIFSYSYQMPSADGVAALSSPAPDFSLQDQNKQVVELADFHGRTLVVTFYRGFW
ncbi:MAG: hypothetical protein AB8G99_11895 [Planctomycetaceae bacterium]